MDMHIRDISDKITCSVKLLKDTHPKELMELLNQNRREKVPKEIGVKHFMECLARAPSMIHNWEKKGVRIDRGFLIAFTQFIGFGPNDKTLFNLSEQHSAEAFLVGSIELLENLDWTTDEATKRCWLSFLGTPDHIRESGLFNSSQIEGLEDQKLRGLGCGDFEIEAKRVIEHTKPSLPKTAYFQRSALNSEGQFYDFLEYRGTAFDGRKQLSYDIPCASGSRIETEATDTVDNATKPKKHPNDNDALGLQLLMGMENTLPTRRIDEATRLQKIKLYGGSLKTKNMGFDPVRHVVNEHSFARVDARKLEKSVCDQKPAFEAYMVRAQHGEGLSFLLAELVVNLKNKHGLDVNWVVGDRNKTKDVLSNLQNYIDSDPQPENSDRSQHIVIVLDDLSEELQSSEALNFQRWNECLEKMSFDQNQLKITLVLGVFGNFYELVPCKNIELRLRKQDLTSCFQKMCEIDTPILENKNEDIENILTKNPNSRSYGNDTQAFIDYLLEHGQRTQTTSENWIVNVDNISEEHKKITELTSVCGLLGLSLQENVALSFANSEMSEIVSELEEVALGCDVLCVVSGEWIGLSLTSPRRAASILQQYQSFGSDKIAEKLFAVLDTSLHCYEQREVRKDECLEFSRHIIQRLNKPELYKLPNQKAVATNVLERSIDQVEIASKQFELENAAKWAGSLSTTIPNSRYSNVMTTPLQQRTAGLIISLIELVISKNENGAVPGPEVALSIFKSLRRLKRGNLFSNRCHDVFSSMVNWLNLEAFNKFGTTQQIMNSEQLSYRLNELFKAATELKVVFKKSNELAQSYEWCEGFEQLAEKFGVKPDAGSLIEFSRLSSSEEERVKNLTRAEIAAKEDPLNQATWLPAIKKELRKGRRYV